MMRAILGVLLALGVGAGAICHAADVVAVDAYPLATCAVCGGKLDAQGVAIVKVYEGRELRFCAKACQTEFENGQAAALKKADEAIVAAQKAAYPLTTCPVSGNILGSMGDPLDIVYNNHLVRLCCSGCETAFHKDPAKSLAKVAEAIADKQRESYPLDTCVISGDKLGSHGEPVDCVVGAQLVRLCCPGCEKKVKEDPAGTLEKIRGAASSKN